MKKKSGIETRTNRTGIYFVLPFIVVYAAFQLWPVIYTLALGFSDIKGFKTDMGFAGLANFKRLVTDKNFWNSVKNTFYMLSDEDKKDVVDHIDEYSLEEIEAKLSVICVRNKVSFAALDDDNQTDPTVYNLGGNLYQDESTPAWVKAVLEKAKTL